MTPGLRRATLAAGGAVGLSAAVATAHGAYEVARACGVPAGIAALYPAIIDGLALVAYATTTRLAAGGRRYAWTIVVLAAGLSGIAQATYLAGSVEQVPTWLRFGIGAWPAVAAALVAHLLYLLARRVEPDVEHPVQPSIPVPRPRTTEPADECRREPAQPQSSPVGAPASARERALAVARDHRGRRGSLPTVSVLAASAGVARGTAATALQELRADPVVAQVGVPSERGGA